MGYWREVFAQWVQPILGDIMKIGDLAIHRFDKTMFIVTEVGTIDGKRGWAKCISIKDNRTNWYNRSFLKVIT